MKNKRKYAALLLAVLFAVSLQVPVAASADPEPIAATYIPITPLWQNVERATANVTFAGTTAHGSATIVGLAGTTSITATMTLERVSGNSVTWSTSWTRTANSSRLVMSESATVTQNGTYRLRVDAAVVRNGVTERISISG